MILPGTYQNGFAPRDGEPLYPELQVGCVGSWSPCLGPTGLVLRDWSGRQNHGTLTNMDPGTDWVPSGGRWALDFDGSNEYVLVPHASHLDFEYTDKFSLVTWVSLRSLSDGMIVAKELNSSTFAGYYLVQNLDGGQWRMSMIIQGTVANLIYVRFGDVDLTGVFGQVIPIIVTYDGTGVAAGVRGYMRGQSSPLTVMSDNLAGNSIRNVVPLQFGARETGSVPYNGQILESRIYNRVLSPSEARILMLRPGIAHELAPVRYAGESAGFLAAWRRQQSFIIGGGLQ